MLAKDASLMGLKDDPGQETELSIASRSLFTNDLLPCPATGAEEGLAAGDVLSTGCENLCKLLQREVQIWSDTCHSFANSRKLSGILQDGVDYVAALALVLFVLACRVNKMEVAAVVASWVLRISLLAFTQAASIPAAALLACVVALATMRLTNESPLPSASAVQSFFLQFGVAFIAVTGMSEWPVVGLALLAASMASVLVLLAVHGPEGQAGCSVSKSVWSNANMTKQGKKSRRRFLWLLRDSSCRIPRPCISIAALDDAISEVTRLRGLLSDLAALVLEELKKASDSAAPQADNSSDSEAPQPGSCSESASAPLPHSTAAAATTVHVKVPTTDGHTRLSVEALTVEDAMTKLAASAPHLAWETFWLSHHGRLLKTLPTDCDPDNPIDVILRCPGGGNGASRRLRQPLEELGETLRSGTGDTRATPPTSNEAAAGSPAEDGEEGMAKALERE